MTNTKFRKRALLSSVAMLLVALVALGSATFAWFVANPTANAEGLKLTTSAEPGVAVASATVLGLHAEGEDYNQAYKASTVLYATGTMLNPSANKSVAAKNLQPVSPNVTIASGSTELSFAKIAAQFATGPALDSTKPWENYAANDLYDEIVYLKASTTEEGQSGPTVKQATATITLAGETPAAVAAGVRVALVSSQGELIGIWKPSSGTATKTWNGTLGTSGGLTDSAYSYTASGTPKAITTAIPTSTAISNTGTTTNFIHVYVYLDGEDAAVYSNNVPQLVDIVSGIDVSISTAALT